MPSLAEAFAAYDPQRAIPLRRPTNEDYWRERLGNQGAISKPERTLGGLLASALTAGAKKAGAGDRYARHIADRATSAITDLTPVGNAVGAEQGGKQAYRGLTRGDLKQAAIGAGIFGLSMAPFAGGAKKSLGALLRDEAGAIRYHGTTEIFDQFDPAKSNGLYFFSDSPEIARAYGHRIKAADIDFKNPLAVPHVPDTSHIPGLAEKAKAAGHDGLIIENINDVGGPQRQHVAFSPPKIIPHQTLPNSFPSNDTGDGLDTVRPLADFLTDPRPTHSMYRTGDVLRYNGEIGEVVSATDAAVVLNLPSGRMVIPRRDPNLDVAPYDKW